MSSYVFEVEEACAAVGFGEAFEGAVAVLEDASVEEGGDADVERAGVAPHDVGVSGGHDAMVAVFASLRHGSDH